MRTTLPRSSDTVHGLPTAASRRSAAARPKTQPGIASICRSYPVPDRAHFVGHFPKRGVAGGGKAPYRAIGQDWAHSHTSRPPRGAFALASPSLRVDHLPLSEGAGNRMNKTTIQMRQSRAAPPGAHSLSKSFSAARHQDQANGL